MKKIIRNGIAVMIAILMLTAVGCTKKDAVPQEPVENPVTVDEAKTLLNKLIPQAFELYRVYFAGDAKFEVPNESSYPEDGWYKVVDERFSSIDELKELTEKTFTKEYASERLYKFAFEGVDDMDPSFEMRGDELWYRDGAMGWSINWLVDTATIKSQTDVELVLSMEKTSFDESDGVGDIVLNKIDGEWRLNSNLM